MIRETERSGIPGLPMLLALLAAGALATYFMIGAFQDRAPMPAFAWMALDVVLLACVFGVFVVNPNEGRVLQLFGAYRGHGARRAGLRWANPFYTKRHISLRVRNFESARSRSTTTTATRSRSPRSWSGRWWTPRRPSSRWTTTRTTSRCRARRPCATWPPATPTTRTRSTQVSLRGSTAAVAKELQHEVQERLAKAGVEVIEARISHLAYAPEIASAMLRRQQAGAIIAARQKIVEGAVGMVEMALELLAKSKQVQLDEERKAAMVSNLLVVLCADREAQPVVNTGTLYQ